MSGGVAPYTEARVSFNCPACLSLLTHFNYGEYVYCSHCGSAVLVSKRTAEEDNKAYFEKSSYAYSPPISTFRKYLLALLIVASWMVRKDIRQYRAMTMKIRRITTNSKRVLEVGFGNGVWLQWLLEQGVDAYGIDLSHEAVDSFRSRWPQHAERVSQGTHLQGSYDLIYANALFEHLDRPDQFLEEVASALTVDGRLILGFPTRSRQPTRWPDQFDINFWVPCHRTLYSMRGVESLFERHNLKLQGVVSCDPYAYRVMNALLANGYSRIHTYRTPVAVGSDIPGGLEFARALIQAFSIASPTRETCVIATLELAKG